MDAGGARIFLRFDFVSAPPYTSLRMLQRRLSAYIVYRERQGCEQRAQFFKI